MWQAVFQNWGTTWTVFENRAVRKIFRHTIHEVAGGWRKLRDGELQNFHYSKIFPTFIK
jgi:hypothetical protein